MVLLTLNLEALTLPESNSGWMVSLQESAKCLIFGLPKASVALARVAIESCLCDAYAKLPGNSAYAARSLTLDDLISNLSKSFNLSKGAIGLSPNNERSARYVQNIANSVLHDSRIEEV